MVVSLYAACRAVRDRLTAVLKLLNELALGNNANRAVEARSLLSAVEMHFVVMFVLMCDIFWMNPGIILHDAVFNFGNVASS